MRACKFDTVGISGSKPMMTSPRFTLTPQRMRMIVEAFKDTLELGLSKPEQIVVCVDFPAGFHNPPDMPGTNT